MLRVTKQQNKMAEPEATLVPPTFTFHEGDTITILAGSEEHELIVFESCITRKP